MNQPFATMLAIGAKKIETRGYNINHRGLIGIYSTINFPDEYMLLTYGTPFKKYLAPLGYKTADDLPRGFVIGVCEVIECCKWTPFFEVPEEWNIEGKENFTESDEYQFGYYGINRTMTYVEKPLLFDEPVKARPPGASQVWDASIEVSAKIYDALKKQNALKVYGLD